MILLKTLKRQKNGVIDVPGIVLNERTELVDAVPEAQPVAHALQAANPPAYMQLAGRTIGMTKKLNATIF